MAILTSLFSGVSGLNSFGTGLSVVSNNIANLNTVGYKDNQASFANIIGQSLGGASAGSQIGRGVYVNDIRTQFLQGSFETTGNALDMAVDGNGFFVVRNAAGGEFYSRAGIFHISQSGLVENPDGMMLQGIQANATGTLSGQVGDINLASTVSPPLATTQVTLVANLDSRVAIPAAFSAANAAGTSNFSTSLTVYDSLGNGHLVTAYFRKSAQAATGNTWQYFVVVDQNDSTSGATEVQAQGTLTFTTDGKLNTESAVTYPLASGGFNFTGGATQGQVIGFDFGTSITTNGGTGLDGTTQFGSTSALLQQTQNGYGSGSLQNVSINSDGLITGLFTNGKSRTLGQVVLSRFNDPQGLTPVGENLFGLSGDSGQPIIGVANSAGMGKIVSNSIELSNVDLAHEFVKMIEYQRGFQANSRVISTTDEILQELVNLKR